jgi:hypothetical protein
MPDLANGGGMSAAEHLAVLRELAELASELAALGSRLSALTSARAESSGSLPQADAGVAGRHEGQPSGGRSAS